MPTIPLFAHLLARRFYRPLVQLLSWFMAPLIRHHLFTKPLLRLHVMLARRAGQARCVQLFGHSSLAYDLAAVGHMMFDRASVCCRRRMLLATDPRLLSPTDAAERLHALPARPMPAPGIVRHHLWGVAAILFWRTANLLGVWDWRPIYKTGLVAGFQAACGLSRYSLAVNTAVHSIFTVSERARRYLAGMPPAVSGQDGHGQTFAAACALVHGFALGDTAALALLHEYNQRCLPPWSDRELLHKLASARLARHDRPRGHLLGVAAQRLAPRVPAPPAISPPSNRIDPATAVENYLRGFHCDAADIWEASPVRPPGDWRLDAVTLLAALYEPDERINYVVDYIAAPDKSGTLKARPQGIGETVERDALIPRWTQTMPSSPAGGWLRMNPVDGCGVADANVTAFRFALLECDSIPLGLQLSLFARLPLPIAAILTSGGRSFHAWVKVDASDADDYRAVVSRMLNLLSRCGVDRKNKNPARLSRLPGVRRTIGADGPGLQRLLYLNPDPQQRTIL